MATSIAPRRQDVVMYVQTIVTIDIPFYHFIFYDPNTSAHRVWYYYMFYRMCPYDISVVSTYTFSLQIEIKIEINSDALWVIYYNYTTVITNNNYYVRVVT